MISNAAFKELRTLLDSGQSDKAKERLLALQAGYFSLMEEIQHLHLRITCFEDLLACSKNVRKTDGLVWLEAPGGRVGPFCPLCHETDKSLIRLNKSADCLICPSCEAEYPLPAPARHKAALLPFDKSCRRLGL